MNRLEYLSGFSIGHILSKVLREKEEGSIVIEDYLHTNYNRLWQLFHQDVEFIKGLKIGLKIENLPVLTDNIVDWFNILIESMGYAMVITQKEKVYS